MASPELLTRALRPLSSGAWQEAETAARAAIADDPDDPHAALLLALAVASMGEADRAAPLLMHAGAMRRDACHPCLELARLKPPLPRALIARQFRACLRHAQSDDRLRLNFATFLLDTDQAAEAKAILADGQASVAGHHLMGLVEAELGHFMAAIDSFECALALEPDNAASWSNLGMMMKVEGRFDEAIAAHDRAVALDPANHRLRVNRAVALLKKGDWEPAWLDYEFKAGPDRLAARRPRSAYANLAFRRLPGGFDHPGAARGRLRRHVAIPALLAAACGTRRKGSGTRPAGAGPADEDGARRE